MKPTTESDIALTLAQSAIVHSTRILLHADAGTQTTALELLWTLPDERPEPVAEP